MSDETKARALEKWSTFLPKIGYPDTWRSWDGLEIVPGDYFANVRAANAFNERYDLDKIGKSTDRYEWHMTPQTVNAYYSSGTRSEEHTSELQSLMRISSAVVCMKKKNNT